MARLTPLEIQKHRFSRKWKGLDPTEVAGMARRQLTSEITRAALPDFYFHDRG
mgnify:CR=1 FL=1